MYKVLGIWKGYHRVKKITSFMHETVNRGKKLWIYEIWLQTYIPTVVNWTIKDNIEWNFAQNTKSFIQDTSLENAICKMAVTLSKSRCVNNTVAVIICLYKTFTDWLTIMNTWRSQSCITAASADALTHDGSREASAFSCCCDYEWLTIICSDQIMPFERLTRSSCDISQHSKCLVLL